MPMEIFKYKKELYPENHGRASKSDFWGLSQAPAILTNPRQITPS
jgi:hypothetical protein